MLLEQIVEKGFIGKDLNTLLGVCVEVQLNLVKELEAMHRVAFLK